MKALPFWIAAVGGLLVGIASITSLPGLISAAGAALFMLGVILFFVVAMRQSREEGVALTAALGQGMRDAFRFAWQLMP